MEVSAVVAGGAIGDTLVEKIQEDAAKIKVGLGNDPASGADSLITKVHRGKVAFSVPDPADAPTGVDLGFPRNH